MPQTAAVVTMRGLCGSTTVSAAYRYERTSVGSNVTEHIVEARCRRNARNVTLVLPAVGAHNFGHRFSVGEGIVNTPAGGAEPFYPSSDSSPLLLERRLLPDRHGFLQVNLARIAPAEVQPRVAHLPRWYAGGRLMLAAAMPLADTLPPLAALAVLMGLVLFLGVVVGILIAVRWML